MRVISCVSAAVMAGIFFAPAVHAAEIRVISSDGFALVLDSLKADYERASGNTLVIDYEVANLLKENVMGGSPFDIVITTAEAITEIMDAGKVASETRVDLARSGLGVAYKAGTPAPDIHDGETFKNAMLGATSVAYLPNGSTGSHFVALVTGFGILSEVEGKATVLDSATRAATTSAGTAGQNTVLQAVLDGTATYGIQAISNILPVEGVEYVSFPADLQKYRDYSGAISKASSAAEAATTLLEFLADSKNAIVYQANGMEPR